MSKYPTSACRYSEYCARNRMGAVKSRSSFFTVLMLSSFVAPSRHPYEDAAFVRNLLGFWHYIDERLEERDLLDGVHFEPVHVIPDYVRTNRKTNNRSCDDDTPRPRCPTASASHGPERSIRPPSTDERISSNPPATCHGRREPCPASTRKRGSNPSTPRSECLPSPLAIPPPPPFRGSA